MRDYKEEFKKRVQFIKEVLNASSADGIIYGNSGGKDSTLVGILCKAACENTLGIIMPCDSVRNLSLDKDDAIQIAQKYNIETRTVDLTEIKRSVITTISKISHPTESAQRNIAPRLRMTTLYTIAASENRIVAGTGNRSEGYMGYFTKWGDGAYDFNPISDLTVKEVYEFLIYLKAPESIIKKPPSAGLFDGQTDEKEMGITYTEIDEFLLNGNVNEKNKRIINKFHQAGEHKRLPAIQYNAE